jgi:hypothetical protein
MDKRMPMNQLLGMQCTEIVKQDYAWTFVFGVQQATLNLECPWRLLLQGAIAYGYEDDGQKFGLPEPVDGVRRATELIGSSQIASVEVRPGPSDLVITFRNGVTLEALNMSSGYEVWICNFQNGTTVVAQGGGDGTLV